MTPRLLVHTRTTAYRHDSIPAAITAVRTLGAFEVDATEDPAALEASLDGYAAVVFLSTSGEVLTPAGRERLAAYVESGGGFVGVHAAACTEYEWPYYGELLGARFARHPAYQPGKAIVEDRDHPATRHLPAVWDFTDEWYDFRTNPRGAVWAPTTRWSGAVSRARAASSTRPSATPPRPTRIPTSGPTCWAGSSGRRGSPEVHGVSVRAELRLGHRGSAAVQSPLKLKAEGGAVAARHRFGGGSEDAARVAPGLPPWTFPQAFAGR
jgi:hypothetical protein